MGSLAQFIHFHLVGAMGTLINLGTLALAHDVVGVPVYPALVISFTAAVVFNFILIKKWTFKDNRWGLGITLRQLCKFYSIAVSGLLFNLGLFFMIHDIAGVNLYIAQTLAIIAAAPIHFFLNRYFTFQTDPAGVLDVVLDEG